MSGSIAENTSAAQPTGRRTPLSSTCAQPHRCAPDVRLRVLGQTPLFAGLSTEEIESIDTHGVAVLGRGRPALPGRGSRPSTSVTVGALLAGVPLGGVTMAIGMLVHELSVLVVIVNAMRLLRRDQVGGAPPAGTGQYEDVGATRRSAASIA